MIEIELIEFGYTDDVSLLALFFLRSMELNLIPYYVRGGLPFLTSNLGLFSSMPVKIYRCVGISVIGVCIYKLVEVTLHAIVM
jgi:hypothetical protein